jgi:hypothetical protein
MIDERSNANISRARRASGAETMSTFKRTDKQNDRNLRGQAELVMLAIEAFPEGATIEQLTPIVVDAGLKTRQDASRIVSYYVSIFKKQGLVTLVKPAVEVEVKTPVAVEATEEVEELTEA